MGMKVGIFSSPFLTLQLFVSFIFLEGKIALNYVITHPIVQIILTSLIVLWSLTHLIPMQIVKEMDEKIMWFGYWFFLGILSSVGLGSGAHTFILFLGPLIAKVTTFSSVCESLNFSLHGASSFMCKDGQTAFSLFDIFNKIKWISFFWGAGTAFGELPPFFIARAAARTGKHVQELDQLQQEKPNSISQLLKFLMHSLLKKFGFWGILLCASIPNPLFDLAGITCGYFNVPFATFFVATFIGKALIKASLQSFFVIVLFSKRTMDMLLMSFTERFPLYGEPLSAWAHSARLRFDDVQGSGSGLINWIWNILMIFMIGYFVVEFINAISLIEYERRKKNK